MGRTINIVEHDTQSSPTGRAGRLHLKYLFPRKAEAVLCHDVGLWLDGKYRCNLVLANVRGVKEPWAVITDENPSLQTLWQYGLRFRVEELF